ncbi:hypothetical protein HO133_002100 [Letharia lupina]|uniref:Uncharacterized protein n=1 Tax=Letharia lupina TaxID=560253 RepID=A0A8H6CD81_9LECA|nr:uncharacterized protein HO133_002100 [Letharia lupina]KAF6221245.1 hypothetical protein HO133_002100 [Letharia lupina]
MEDDYELAHSPGVTKMPEQIHYTHRGSIDRDEADLMRLGKKPVLKTELTKKSVFDIGFAKYAALYQSAAAKT